MTQTALQGVLLSAGFFMRRRALAVLVLVNLFMLTLALFFLFQSRHEYQVRAEVTTRNLAQALEKDIDGTLDKLDLALLGAADEAERQLAAGGIDAAGLTAFFARTQGRLPEVISLRATDAAGQVRYGPGVDASTKVSLSDRDFFIRGRDVGGLVISDPVFARVSQRWVLPISRPIRNPDGSFAGVVYVNIALDDLVRAFSTLEVGRHGAISLRDGRLGLIARYPQLGDQGRSVGQQLVAPQLREQVARGEKAGTFVSNVSVDGMQRLYSFVAVGRQPLYVTVGFATDDYLAEWRSEVLKVAALVALFIAVTLAAFFQVGLAWKRQLTAAAALAREEERFRALVETSSDWIWELDRQLSYRYSSPRVKEILGYGPEEMIGRSALVFMDGAEAQRAGADFDALMSERTPLFGAEYTKRHRDGHEVVLEVSAVPSFAADGSVDGCRGIERDVTARKAQERALKRLNETLDQRVREEVEKNLANERLLIQQSRMAQMGEMVGNIAHQWRQPLNAVNLVLANIKDDFDFKEMSCETLTEQVNQGRRLTQKMSDTIDDFRNFFRPTKDPQLFGLHQALTETLHLLGASLSTHGIELSVTGEEVQACGFSSEFSQVLLNVIGNAKDALTARGRSDGRIGVSIGAEGGGAVMRIADNAGGVEPALLPRIFEPYFTTKEKGTGIGLYMSRMIMEHMGGSIDAHNREEGLEVVLSLPMCETKEQCAAMAAAAAQEEQA